MSDCESAYSALESVVDPELDESITTLGFIRSLTVSSDGDVKLNLRLPTSFCSPNFAYLMASDARDVLCALTWTRSVVVELDDHHDSDIINAGLASAAGYRGTFGDEAEDSLDELRETFRRKAHTAAMERCLSALLKAEPARAEVSLAEVTLADLPAGADTSALLSHRAALELPTAPDALVMVDHLGQGCSPDTVSVALRRARSTRISIEGNAHFCRGLLRTRYGDETDSSTTVSAQYASKQREGMP